MADVSDLSNVEINLDKVCRTCLSESDNMKSVFCFDDKIENMSLNLLVTSCTQLNMTRGDGLPERICIQCVEDVSSAFAFKLQAEKVDARLREYVSRKYPHLQLLHDNPIKVENDKLNENNDLDQKDDVKNGDFDCFSSQFETCNLEDSMNENRLYSCKFCDHYYHGEDQMTDHLVTVHEDKLPSPRKRGRPSRKDVSSRKAEILSLLNSMKVENEEGISDNTKNYNLNYADPTSILDSLSNKDIESSKDKEKKPHMCKLCDKAFVSSGQLKKHTASHKQRQTTPAPGSSAKRKPTPIAEDIELVKIKVESVDNNTEMFMEELGLQVNEKSPESPVNMGYDFDMGDDADNFDIDSDVDFTVGYTKKKSKKKTKHPHKCTMCGETFSRTSYIIRHMLTHNIQIPSSCDKCLQVFPSDELLANHLCMSKKVSQSKSKEFLGIRLIGSKSEHKKKGAVRKKREKKAIEKKEKTFKCSLCEKAFYSQGTLDRHGRTHLPKEKRFECPVCQKKFFRKDKMNMHAQIHNPNRAECTNFLCLYCGHSFKNSSNLIVHMRRHTGEKPYKCDMCPKGFPRSTDLQTHRLTHTGEKPCVCKVCGKAFGRSSKLVRHMRIHTGQKPYKCMYCDRAFTQSNDLTLHVRRHTGEKPYVCGLCGDKFFNNTALQAHKRSQNHFEPPNPAPTEEKTSNF